MVIIVVINVRWEQNPSKSRVTTTSHGFSSSWCLAEQVQEEEEQQEEEEEQEHVQEEAALS